MKEFEMKKMVTVIVVLGVLVGTTVMAAGWTRGNATAGSVPGVTAPVEAASLSAAERDGVLLMREEEKLARDVYLTLYETWGVQTFANIARSESTHMEAMSALIEQYNLADPVKTDERGVFTDPALQALYNDLVAEGSQSVTAALAVGAQIEDLDMRDLQNLIAATDNADIQIVYQNLLNGSANHIKAFTSQLARYGESYTAQYLTDTELSTVLNSPAGR